MTEAVVLAVVTGLFGLLTAAVGQLAVLLNREGRRSERDKGAHESMADQLAELKAHVREVRLDVGGMRSEIRGLANRVTHVDERLDAHLDR